MFKPLGLFSARCPEIDCKRINCFFKHGEPSRQPTPNVRKESGDKHPVNSKRPRPSTKNDDLSSSTTTTNAKVATDGIHSEAIKPDPTIVKKARTIPTGTGTPSSLLKVSKQHSALPTIASTTSPTEQPELSQRPAVTSFDPNRDPIIPRQKGASPQPYVDRQKALTTLYQQYVKLYSPILALAPDLAHRSSVAQEAEISSSSANVRSYKTAIHHAAVNISRRPIPDSLDHPSVGTVKESRIAVESAEKVQASRPTRDRVKDYCLPLDQFVEWRYPDPTDGELITGGGENPSAEGTSQECSRCRTIFVVTPAKDADPHGCKFHYGKTAPERIEGRRKWIYSCCGRERGEMGCQDGLHVFTEREDDNKLKSRVGFRTVNQVLEGVKGPRGWVDVVAMDCEMIYTTAGSSLARVTIVDEDGGLLLDELVRQTASILDLNSRFSGINGGDLDKSVMDLTGARAASCMFIGPDTIIVGHGLENDLRALRLVHDKVIDTAILFPHDKGRPFRRALRDIVKEKLGYFIQDRTSDLGHSSAEDAKATLECLKWKVRSDR